MKRKSSGGPPPPHAAAAAIQEQRRRSSGAPPAQQAGSAHGVSAPSPIISPEGVLLSFINSRIPLSSLTNIELQRPGGTIS